MSTAYDPAADKRAEVGAKSAKRIIRENVGPNGTLNTNKMTQALLAHQNCPNPTMQILPAQIVFVRPIWIFFHRCLMHQIAHGLIWLELVRPVS